MQCSCRIEKQHKIQGSHPNLCMALAERIAHTHRRSDAHAEEGHVRKRSEHKKSLKRARQQALNVDRLRKERKKERKKEANKNKKA